MYLFTDIGRNILPMFPLDEVIVVQWWYVDIQTIILFLKQEGVVAVVWRVLYF